MTDLFQAGWFRSTVSNIFCCAASGGRISPSAPPEEPPSYDSLMENLERQQPKVSTYL